jgi:cell wall-associated NlpC family hydrolase
MISQPATMVREMVLIGAVLLALGGCASSPVANEHGGDHVGDHAARVALSQVGAPYRYGGATPAGFDCSGLVQYSYQQAGMSIPRTTAGQWARLAPVDNREMRTGDLLFFSIEGKMSHVGLYLGDGKFVHAPSSGRKVEIERLDSDFYRQAFLRAGRP